MPRLSKLRQINIAAPLAAAAGILLIFASAPDLFPAVPPGPIIFALTATFVAFVPGRAAVIVGVAVPAFIIVGGIVSGGLADNLHENAGAITGTAIQLTALVTAIAAGALTLSRSPRSTAIRNAS